MKASKVLESLKTMKKNYIMIRFDDFSIYFRNLKENNFLTQI